MSGSRVPVPGDSDFDAVVVGAGPAGSTAAWKLAGSGVRVLLVDGAEFPRSKPCGEAVSPGAIPLLDEMGVLERLRAEGAVDVEGFRLQTPAGRTVSAGFGPSRDGIPSEALALSRRRLDAVLLEAAIEAGAEFRAPLRVFEVDPPEPKTAGDTGAPVRLRVRDRAGRESTLGARWVIGADGLRSVVARRVMGVRRGRRDRLAVVGRYRLQDTGNGSRAGGGDEQRAPSRRLGELRLSARGVLGAAPIEDGLWTVAVVVSRDRASRISDDPFGFFRTEIEAYGFPAPEATGELAEELQVTGPFEIAPRAVTAPGVVLAGDAAGYFDPFTGQGIYRALVTGRHAAAAVTAALADPSKADAARRRYSDELARLLVPGRRVQKLVDAVVSRPALINPAGRLMERRPGLLSHLLDVTGDRVPPRELLRPSALAAAWRRRGSRS